MERRSGRTSETSEREKSAMKREIIKDRRLTNSEVAASFGQSSYVVVKILKRLGYERKWQKTSLLSAK